MGNIPIVSQHLNLLDLLDADVLDRACRLEFSIAAGFHLVYQSRHFRQPHEVTLWNSFV
jgi:hypothetical protein